VSDSASNRVSLSGVPANTGIAAGAKSAGLLTVTVGGVPIIMQANRDVTFAAGDRVAVVKANGIWIAVCRLDAGTVADQPDNPPPPPPKPTVVTGTKVFSPVETRSYRTVFGGWRTDTDDVYQGQFGGNGNHTGCAFYGNGPRSLAGATVTGASVKLKRKSAGGVTAAQDTTFWLITQRTRPSGAPTRGASTDGPNLRWGQAGTFTIPTSWAQAMVDGTAGGLGIFESDGAPYVILDGRGAYGASFQLTIKWRR
jgi:hypothetical protein